MKKVITGFFLAGVLIGGLYVHARHQMATRMPVISIQRDEKGSGLFINKRPFLIRGVCYSPIPVGRNYEYNFWGDTRKPWLVDGKLMKQMGVNTARVYRPSKNPLETRRVLHDLQSKFGIYTMMGHYLGFWNWPLPNYSDDKFKEKVRLEVLEMVRLYKDSPGVLMWVLGNENNLSFDKSVQRWSSPEIDAMTDSEDQRKERARIYYTFVNELAVEIKKIDSRRPVAMGVGEVESLQFAQKICTDIDVIAMIVYRGPGFGNLFKQIQKKFDLPVVIAEYGADSYHAGKRREDEDTQAKYLEQQTREIDKNIYGEGTGNVLGGVIFEWMDEWWKGSMHVPLSWSVHDTAGNWYNSSYQYDAYGIDKLNMNEEWWGLVKQNPNRRKHRMVERIPKKAYWVLKQLWAA